MTGSLPLVLALVAGACLGSFLNVCVARWPAGLSVVSPGSRCPHCARPVRAWENVPVLGWIGLRGRCAGCRGVISPQYPLVELAVALLWLAVVWRYGPTFTALRVAVLLTVLGGVALTDAKHYVIPDGFTIFGLVWVITTAVAGVVVGDPGPFAAPYDALIGACTGAGAIAIVGWLGEAALGREAMGFGDVTLMAVGGAALGPARALLTIFLAAAIGLVVFGGVVIPFTRLRRGRGDDAAPLVPFGVFLAPGTAVALLAGGPLLQWYTTRLLVP